MVVTNIKCGIFENKKLSTNKSNQLSLPDTTLGLTYSSVRKKQKLAKKELPPGLKALPYYFCIVLMILERSCASHVYGRTADRTGGRCGLISGANNNKQQQTIAVFGKPCHVDFRGAVIDFRPMFFNFDLMENSELHCFTMASKH